MPESTVLRRGAAAAPWRCQGSACWRRWPPLLGGSEVGSCASWDAPEGCSRQAVAVFRTLIPPLPLEEEESKRISWLLGRR